MPPSLVPELLRDRAKDLIVSGETLLNLQNHFLRLRLSQAALLQSGDDRRLGHREPRAPKKPRDARDTRRASGPPNCPLDNLILRDNRLLETAVHLAQDIPPATESEDKLTWGGQAGGEVPT